MRNPEDSKKSLEVLEFATDFRLKQTEKAQKIISDSLCDAANALKSLLDSEDEKVVKDAAVQILKFGGLAETQNLKIDAKFEPVKFLLDLEAFDKKLKNTSKTKK